MSRKDFVHLIEENMLILDRLSGQLKRTQSLGFPRQQLMVLVRLHIGGPACLKDIAAREHVPTPNLCTTFRKLEANGLVQRTIDDKDRRNTWYAVTPVGEHIAMAAMEKLRAEIESLFAGMSAADERDLTAALKTMNSILSKMESKNA